MLVVIIDCIRWDPFEHEPESSLDMFLRARSNPTLAPLRRQLHGHRHRQSCSELRCFINVLCISSRGRCAIRVTSNWRRDEHLALLAMSVGHNLNTCLEKSLLQLTAHVKAAKMMKSVLTGLGFTTKGYLHHAPREGTCQCAAP